jgi:RTX calcium-binding nonapeptide repeat (4 copies)
MSSCFVSFHPKVARDASAVAFWLKNPVERMSKMARIVMSETFVVEYNLFNRVFEPGPLSLGNPFGTGNNDLGYQDFGRVLRANASTEFSYRSVAPQSPYDTDDVRINFSGSGFEYATTTQNNGLGPITVYGAPNKGTVNSINISIVDRTSRQPGLTTETITVAITDIAINLTDLDPKNYKTMIARLTTGDDQIYGSNIADIINAGAGNDTVYGNGGNDTIDGGTGNDIIDGGDGDDILLGGAGVDHIVGGGGNDRIEGGDGNDTLIGQGGNDTIFGGAGDDTLSGESGNDLLYADSGNDILFGGIGDDQLFGGDGNDTLDGGAGNDWLVGGAGYDTLVGGDGDDGFVYDPNDNVAGYSGGAGFDTLFFDAAGPAVNINLAAQGFEQAIGTRTDTNNQAWATNTNIYDAAWRLVTSEYVNDNGTKDIYRFDPGNNQPWKKIQSLYASDGKLDYEITFFDDGSSKLVDFDLTNSVVWSSRTTLVNAAGIVTSDTFVLDALTGLRSADMRAPVAAAQATQMDIL